MHGVLIILCLGHHACEAGSHTARVLFQVHDCHDLVLRRRSSVLSPMRSTCLCLHVKPIPASIPFLQQDISCFPPCFEFPPVRKKKARQASRQKDQKVEKFDHPDIMIKLFLSHYVCLTWKLCPSPANDKIRSTSPRVDSEGDLRLPRTRNLKEDRNP